MKKVSKSINAPFGYFGSKNKIVMQLCGNLPPHNCWVEAFCGSAVVTLNKKPASIEVINDIDNEIVNCFRQLRDNTEALLRSIDLTPYAETELINARIEENDLNDLERARRFLVQSMMAINGLFGEERGGFSYSDSYSRNGYDARVNRWNNLPQRLKPVLERLKGVRIENKDARRLLERYLNRPATLVYLDPPYFSDRTNGYSVDAYDLDFHIELLELVNKASCMVFISGYDNELYNLFLSRQLGWRKKRIKTSTRDSDGVSHSRVEIVWMNRFYIEALEQGSAPISLSKKESKHGKFNPKR